MSQVGESRPGRQVGYAHVEDKELGIYWDLGFQRSIRVEYDHVPGQVLVELVKSM